MYLLTWHGTLVALERSSGALVHRPITPPPEDAVPLRVVLPSRQLTKPLTSKGGALAGVTIEPGPLPFTAHLKRDGQYLCAEARSLPLSFDRAAPHEWEHFMVIEDDQAALLGEILGSSWQLTPPDQTLRRADIALLAGFVLQLGEVRLPLGLGFPHPLAADTPSEADARQLGLPDGSAVLIKLATPEEDQASPPVAMPSAEPPDEALAHQPDDPEPADVSAEAAEQVVRGWAIRELAPWLLAPMQPQSALDYYNRLAAERPDIYLFELNAGTVTLLPKPGELTQSAGIAHRVQRYTQFFVDVAASLPDDFSTTICVSLTDRRPGNFAAPVFAFQKALGENKVLLPDIDFLINDFYRSGQFADRVAYARKTSGAVFAGSTTGGSITPEVAQALGTPRLRAANYFVGHQRVDFRLPSIVQCTNETAANILRALPFCQTRKLTTQEQFRYKFLISMDGNGATCARVAVALHSHCVLLKYASPEVLYYFAGMQPWVHFVPVARDEEVDQVLRLEGQFPALFAQIARSGQEFARAYLSRERVVQYMAALLEHYAACFAMDGKPVAESADSPYAPGRALRPSRRPAANPLPAPPPRPSRRNKTLGPATQPRLVDEYVAHVQSRGDLGARPNGWVGERRSGKAIEGFSMSFANPALRAAASYQVLDAQKTLSEPATRGDFCGTRSRNRPIYGLCVNLPETDGLALSYEACFVDGTRLGPVPAGTPLSAESGAALEAFRVFTGADGDAESA